MILNQYSDAELAEIAFEVQEELNARQMKNYVERLRDIFDEMESQEVKIFFESPSRGFCYDGENVRVYRDSLDKNAICIQFE